MTGALQASESPGSNGVSAVGGLPKGQTGAISSASLVNLVPYKMYDAWITLAKADSGMTAVPATAAQDTGLDLKAFQNLGYTGEWFVFAGFVVFMWFRLLRREVEFARDAELGLVPDEEPAPDTMRHAGLVDLRKDPQPDPGTTRRRPPASRSGTPSPRRRWRPSSSPWPYPSGPCARR